MKVLKFGGTSVQSAESMVRVLDCILKSCTGGCLVILSAVSGTTDSLIKATVNAIENYDNSIEIINELRNRHIKIAAKLLASGHSATETILKELFEEIFAKLEAIRTLGEITPMNIDSMQAYGERLSTIIFNSYCRKMNFDSILIDSREFIRTDSEFTNAKVDFDLSQLKINGRKDVFESGQIIIAQGFIASDKNARTTTLGRGGSDYSAAVFGKLLKLSGVNVEEIQIWTDVDGVLSADPRIIDTARTIPQMTAQEIRTLSYLGAKVLHPDTIKPAVSMNIPVRVLNTFNPVGSCSTLICDDINSAGPSINSIILIKDCFELTIINGNEISVWELMQKILHIASAGKCHPFFSSLTDNSGKLLFKYNVNLFTESSFSELIKIEQCEILALTGNNLSGEINFGGELSDENLFLAGISETAIFLKSNQKISNEELKILHDRILINNRVNYGKIS